LEPSVRGLLAALSAVVALGLPCNAASQSVDESQRAFEAGMEAAARGRWPIAIVILSDLANRTDQPRVRLELARVYYLSGDYRHAKAEFLKVYRRDIPYPVRRSINIFLDEIDQRIGFLEPQLGLVVDNNPGRTASTGTYEIFGAPFEYLQPDQEEIGLAYRVAGVRPLTASGARRQWVVAGTADGQRFGDAALDWGVYSLALRVDDHLRNDRIALGWRFHAQPASDADGPYVEYFRRLRPRRNGQTVLQFSIEEERYRNLRELNGVTVQLAVDRARDFGPRTSGHVSVGLSGSSVRDSRLPADTAFTVVGASRSFPRSNVSVVANLTLARAWYGRADPFFDERRRDSTAQIETGFYIARPVFGLFPGIVATAEQRGSTIPFYAFHRSGVSVDFRRRF
jgi:hypothetical protein